MKIYFTASASQKDKYIEIYKEIATHLETKGELYQTVLSEHLPDIKNVSSANIDSWYKEWSEYISECDFAVAEVSHPSSAQVGFEIGMILARGKPVVILHYKNKDPIFINDLYSSKVIKSEYDKDSLKEVINWCIEEVESFSKRRFTFYINNTIDEFLDSLSTKRGISKSEIIRDLIEKEMPLLDKDD